MSLYLERALEEARFIFWYYLQWLKVNIHFFLSSFVSNFKNFFTGLFHKAIIQSGCALNSFTRSRCSYTYELALKLGIDNNDDRFILSELQKVPVQELVKASRQIWDVSTFIFYLYYIHSSELWQKASSGFHMKWTSKQHLVDLSHFWDIVAFNSKIR